MAGKIVTVREYEARLAHFLAEGPTENSFLWRARWGSDDGVIPKITARLVDDIEAARSSRAILIHGRYGTGKSSFLKSIERQLSLTNAERKQPIARTLWLHMPVLCGRSGASALADVMAAIVEELHAPHFEFELQPDDDASNRADSFQQLADIEIAMADLWRLESGETVASKNSDVAAPRPSRMSAAAAPLHQRVVKANTLEKMLDAFLQATKSDLVVFLDDLDRCHNQVACDVVRLLLRFGNTGNIHFVIASDRDVLEQGVRDWMHSFGGENGDGPIVTANSAIEKYLHHLVELPDLSFFISTHDAIVVDDIKRTGLLDYVDKDADSQRRDSTLADKYFTELIRFVFAPTEQDLAELGVKALARQTFRRDLTSRNIDVNVHPGRGDLAVRSAAINYPENEGADVLTNRTLLQEPMSGEKDKSRDNENFDSAVEKLNWLSIFFTFARVEPVPLDPSSDQQSNDAPWRGRARLNDKYFWLFAHLSLRQLKHYLRERLTGGAGNGEEAPESGLLRSIFHPFWRLYRDERDLCNCISTLAANVLRASDASRRQRYATHAHTSINLDATAIRHFAVGVTALIGQSSVMTAEHWKETWPRKSRERGLLIALLALLDGSGGSSSAIGQDRPTFATSQPEPSYDRSSSSSEFRYSTYEQSDVSVDNPPSVKPEPKIINARELGIEFAAWARKSLGASIRGQSVADMVSSFQDIALEVSRTADESHAHQIVDEFTKKWMPRLKPFFESATGLSLSNLAVMIDDEQQYVESCDALFEAATPLVQRGSGANRVPMFWADFLMDTVADPSRLDTLLLSGRYLTKSAIKDQVRYLLNEGTDSTRFDLRERLHHAILGARLESEGGDQAKQIAAFQELVDVQGTLFVDAAREADATSAARLADAIRGALGQSPAAIRERVRVLSQCWRDIEIAQTEGGWIEDGSWTVRIQMANALVGVTRDNSPDETLGLRLNAGLLCEDVVLRNDNDRFSAIWSQSGSALANRKGGVTHDLRRRDAVLIAMLTSERFGGGQFWLQRTLKVLASLKMKISATDDKELLVLLRKEISVESLLRVDSCFESSDFNALVELVFDPFTVTPIVTFAEFEMEFRKLEA
jgi:hypothetical protein